MKEIEINKRSQEDLKEIIKTINDLNSKAQIIMRTIQNEYYADGDYILSQDITKLIKKENKE